jgi:formate dehydrogenase gamma subunit
MISRNRFSDVFRKGGGALVFLFMWVLTSPFALAQEECMECHGDETSTRTLPSGAVQSLYIDLKIMENSVHAEFSCVQCHTDLKGFSDWPHPEQLKKVSCAGCHEAEAAAVAGGGHEGKLNCAECHGTHSIIKPTLAESALSKNRVNETCANCHNALHPPRRGRSAVYASYDVGLHGAQPFAGGVDRPGCVDCHSSHQIRGEHRDPAALEKACTICHTNINDEFKESVHAEVEGQRALSHCYDCHGEHRSRAPSDTTLRVTNESPAEATCGSCHAESVARYNQSLHAFALESGSPRAPRCESCHGAHAIYRVDDPRSPIQRNNMVKTCAKCHSQVGISLDPDVRLPRSFENYMESTHGKLLAQGNEEVPVCTDCHGGHAILGSSNPQSTIHLLRIDGTCGRCHENERKIYRTSIHSRALQSGVFDSPTCTGCHGEHLMLSPKDPNSKVSHDRLSKETCAKCHEDPVIIRKYGLAPDVVSTYNDSYHGLAIRAHYPNAPTCADCHLSHGVRSADDSLSTVNPANVVATCGKCHERSDTKFAASYTHRALQPRIGGADYWIARIYWILIIAVIGSMVIHNVIIMNHYILQTYTKQEKGKQVVRFDTHQLVQHMALSVTFILLAITGFALKYPDAWWSQGLSAIGLEEGLRRIIHRVMAIGLVITGFYHVLYLFWFRRGREELRAMLPGKRDVKELAENLKYHVGRSGKYPAFGRYDYSQKAEYWALIWGTILMIATGFVLWFPAELSPILPAWAVSISQTIHLYEAWLATLAIIVWHFFFVIFHPEEYPMSWTWLTGKMSLDSVKENHKGWYKEIIDDPSKVLDPTARDAEKGSEDDKDKE